VIRDFRRWRTVTALLLAGLAGCGGAGDPVQRDAVSAAERNPAQPAAHAACDASADLAGLDATKVSLAQAYANSFAIGVAINRSVYQNQDPGRA